MNKSYRNFMTAKAEYMEAELQKRKRKVALMLSRIEPIEEGINLSGHYQASAAVSLKRIADTLDKILIELTR